MQLTDNTCQHGTSPPEVGKQPRGCFRPIIPCTINRRFAISVCLIAGCFVVALTLYFTLVKVGRDKVIDGNRAPETDERKPHHHEITMAQLERRVSHLKPSLYKLHIDVDRESFTGQVEILFVSINEIRTNQVILHASKKHLDIVEMTLKGGGNSSQIPDVDYWVILHEQYLSIQLSAPLQANTEYSLRMKFNGQYEKKENIGLYTQSYMDNDKDNGKRDNVKMWMASTKFQPIGARRVFPCLDRPDKKADFLIKISHASNLRAYSNERSKEVRRLSKYRHMTEFARVSSIASYLVCFVVCDYDQLQRDIGYNKYLPKQMSIHGRINRNEQFEEVLNKTITYSIYFANMFKIEYPLSKLAHFGIPVYPTSATEHWGIITYDENILFPDGELSDRQQITRHLVIAHELAHNFFGNIVTCKQWGDVWIQEGLATYYAMKAMQHVDESMGAHEEMMTTDRQRVLDIDGANTPALVMNLTGRHPSAVFNIMTYKKGALIFQMIETIIGEASTTSSLNKWMKSYKYGNTDSAELLAMVAKYSEEDIFDKLMGWLINPGYPIIQVGVKSGAYQISRTIHTSNVPQDIPIFYQRTGGEAQNIRHKWLNKNQDYLTLNILEKDTFIKLNTQGRGYYRVLYPKLVWQYFKQNIEHLHQLDAVNLLQDAWWFAGSGHLNYSFAMELSMAAVKAQPRNSGLVKVLQQPAHFAQRLASHQAYPLFQQYMNQISIKPLNSILDILDKKEKPPAQSLNVLPDLIKWYCASNSQQCDILFERINKALRRYENHLPWHKAIIGTMAINERNSGKSDTKEEDLWLRVQNFSSSSQFSNENQKMEVLRQLAKIQSVSSVETFLNNLLNETLLTNKRFFSLIPLICTNPVAKQPIWTWVKHNYEYFVSRFSNMSSFSSMIPYILDKITTTEKELYEVMQFYKQHPVNKKRIRRRQHYLTRTKKYVKWSTAYLPQIIEYLQNNYS